MVIAIVLLGVAGRSRVRPAGLSGLTLLRGPAGYSRIYGALYALFGLGAGFGPASLWLGL